MGKCYVDAVVMRTKRYMHSRARQQPFTSHFQSETKLVSAVNDEHPPAHAGASVIFRAVMQEL